MTDTLANYLASQETLVQEAALALPHSFSQCTYPRGYIRQAVYLCTTCAEPRGLCSACSIACHTDHEQLELFPKRRFRCDCPTRALPHACTLHKQTEDVNTENVYGQNFTGVFCRCKRPYDAQSERETMMQCLACEDWFHESCLNLRERPQDDAPDAPAAADDDAHSEASSSGLPPPLITGDDYDALVCASCVARIPIVKRYAGTQGALMVVRDDPSAPWRILDGTPAEDERAPVTASAADAPATEPKPAVPSSSTDTEVGSKRRLSSAAESTSETKRARVSPAPCLAPPENPVAQRVWAAADRAVGEGDVFLQEGWRARWCRCESCLPQLEAHRFLLEEEETYEPPEDPDSQLSLEELGMRALERIPRDRALDGIRAFNNMRDDLVQFLRPFAQEGKVVAEEDIRAFFDRERASQDQH
ncbi:hypothetical protein DENSPDRAFT_838947 [Dentipellis sp. KUC8613]|nr:hypothetical protein DENSPDRAFT_838947 [Dentipellis sp. KUC8613]